jgi:hypothetical protein
MKVTLFAAFVLMVVALATAELPADGLTSTKQHGVIKLVPDPTLSDGRLVLKVVAFNRDHVPAPFGPESLKVFTASGQQVALMSADQLAKEIQESRSDRASRNVDVFGSSSPRATIDESGRPDVSNYTGGGNSMGSTVSTRAPAATGPSDSHVQQQIADLKAALLKPVTIASAAAAGGQVVTQKLKFARKEEHTLRVVVDFNSEQHEFNFAAPPAH